MSVLSIQSSVAYGHVGNAAAAFCLRRAGREVWPVDTVAFSNHPGHGRFAGRVRPAAEVAEIVDGLAALGLFGRCEAVLSGYLGTAGTGLVALDAAARVKAANPGALYGCDPVMGDGDEGVYVADDVVALFRERLVAAADVVVPNHFELEVLAGRALATEAEVVAAARGLGRPIVVVTSTRTAGAAEISNLVVTADGAWRVSTPRLASRAKGAGDALAALFLHHRLAGLDPAPALAAAVSSVYAVVEATAAAGADELVLVAAQDAIVSPARPFEARAVA